MKTCTHCGESEPEVTFQPDRRICNLCRSMDIQKKRECDRNRQISELLRWPVPERFA